MSISMLLNWDWHQSPRNELKPIIGSAALCNYHPMSSGEKHLNARRWVVFRAAISLCSAHLTLVERPLAILSQQKLVNSIKLTAIGMEIERRHEN